MRKLKFLGLLVIAFAMMGVSSAVAAEFHSEGSSTTLTGTQLGVDEFNTNGGTVECQEATYKGSQTGTTATTVSVAPTYSQCSALSGFASATIDTNGCEYVFHAELATVEATVDIVCPPEKEITVTASSFGTNKCTVHIPPQQDLDHVVFHNDGVTTTREIIVTVTIEGIHYNETKGTGFGACAGGTASNGTYNGEATVTGEHTENGKTTHTGIWVT
jgi:hypothetical protein